MGEEIAVAAAGGIAAGLGLAMPLGAIAALLLREGLVNGFTVAAAGATGVALVDTIYCLVAALAGTAVAPLVGSATGPFLVLAGSLVVLVGLRQLLATRTATAPGEPEVGSTRPTATLVRFVALTAVNPLTLVYFVALAGALTTHSENAAVLTTFVIAVGLTSWAWQLLLAATGSAFGATLGPGATRALGLIASLVILVLGTGVVISGLNV